MTSHQKAVHLAQTGVDFGAVIRPEFHVLAAVHQARQNLVETVNLFLVEGNQAVEVLGRKTGRLGFGHPEELGIVGRHILHVLLEAVQHPGLLLVNISEKTGFIIVDL